MRIVLLKDSVLEPGRVLILERVDAEGSRQVSIFGSGARMDKSHLDLDHEVTVTLLLPHDEVEVITAEGPVVIRNFAGRVVIREATPKEAMND